SSFFLQAEDGIRDRNVTGVQTCALPILKSEIYNYEETSKIYFADNKYMGDITAPLQREEINLDDIAPILIDAVLATEDKDFYEHNGIVPKAIARAAFQEFSG